MAVPLTPTAVQQPVLFWRWCPPIMCSHWNTSMACIWVISGVCVVQHIGHNVSKHRMKRDVQYENEKSNYGQVEDQWIPRWEPLANGVIFTRTIFRWLISCRWHIMSNMLNDTHAIYCSNTCHAYPLTEATLFVSGARPPYWMKATAVTISLPNVEK